MEIIIFHHSSMVQLLIDLADRTGEIAVPAFPNDFKPRHHAADLQRQYGALANEELEPQGIEVAVAGRLMLKRVMGKASFGTLQDASGRLQLFVTKDGVGEAVYEQFKHWDLGDILGGVGTLFKTKTGELSVRVHTLRHCTGADPKKDRPLDALHRCNAAHGADFARQMQCGGNGPVV